MRQAKAEHSAQQYIDMLCRLGHHNLANADTVSLPALSAGNPLRPFLARVKDCIIDYGECVDEAEHSLASAEVRFKRLAADHGRLVEIADGLSDAALAINHYNELVWANAFACDLFAIDMDAESPVELSQKISCPALVDLMTDPRKRQSRSQRSVEVEITDARGESRWYRAACRTIGATDDPYLDEQGATAVLTDITHERSIHKRHAEFVSAASHELKTPLAGIRAYVELLLDKEAEDEATQEEFLNVIDTQADRLQRLIENLLNMARIEAGVVEVCKETHSLNELLEHAFSVVQPSAEQKDIQLVSALSPMYMGVLVDRDMTMQSAINLLSNAIKYTEPGGKVTLRSRMEENAAVFEVEDTGVGLTDEDCKRIFDKFYRVKKDQKMAPGTGLGLPLAKHIVEDVHGGELIVSSQLGAGSVFRISLPMHERRANLRH
jgi:two-component system phosphate regulon sensor histidine kinase PhoR